MFALVDCNNFFVSCERVFRPDLENVPVAVLSNNDGIIIARSNEVKALGIPMGAPRFKFENLIRTHKIQTFSSNFSLYRDLSQRFMKCLCSFSPHVEIYSIDEAFLNCTGLSKNWQELGIEMQRSIHQWLGLPISIGFAPTKTLAKIANRLAKKSDSGVWVLESQDVIEKALEITPVEEIWGVGRQWSQKLRCKGIYTALDLRNVDPRWMRKVFSVVGERLVRELQGYSCMPLNFVKDDQKSLQVSRSFIRPITSFEEIREAIATYVSKVASQLRQLHLKTPALLVTIRTSPFRSESSYESKSIVVTLDQATNGTSTLLVAACKGLEEIFQENRLYKKAGVIALDLMHESVTQLQLELDVPTLFSKSKISCFQKEERQKTQKISRTLDQLNRRYGNEVVLIASCGIKPKWKMGGGLKTPSYTTNWDQLVIVWAK